MRRGWSRVPIRLAPNGERTNTARCDGDEEDDERRIVEGRGAGDGDAERRRAAVQADAVVAVGEADPAIGEAPDDLTERQRDHDEADAGRAQRQHAKTAMAARPITSAVRMESVWP